MGGERAVKVSTVDEETAAAVEVVPDEAVPAEAVARVRPAFVVSGVGNLISLAHDQPEKKGN